jgi:histidyl-tRNA synthetase
MEIKKTCYKGTRILVGIEKRLLLNNAIGMLLSNNFNEISIPIIQYQEIFANKVGEENNNLMFNFTDRRNRQICLAPEYTAVIQKLASTTFKYQKDIKLFYVQECFRGEKPQEGRYRQFTQLGVEIINSSSPDKDLEILQQYACSIIEQVTTQYKLNRGVKRGLDYYKDGQGFEITIDSLGTQKQVCGGGQYEGGVGFAIGIDRILLVK